MTIVFLLGTSSQLVGELTEIWVLNDGLKVKPSGKLWNESYDNFHPDYRSKSSIWESKRKEVTISGAGNEVVSFQVVVHSKDSCCVIGISFTVNESAKFSLQENVASIFWERYIRVNEPSKFNNNKRVRESIGVGHFPDALIPVNRISKKEITNSRTNVFWVDISIPPGSEPGTYLNNLIISRDGSEDTLKVITKVLEFSLPSKSNLKVYWQFFPTSFWRGEGLPETWFGAAKNWELIYDYYRMAAKHGADLVLRSVRPEVKFDENTGEIISVDWKYYDRYMGPILSGEIFESIEMRPIIVEAPIREDLPNGSKFKGGKWGKAHKRSVQEWTKEIIGHFKNKNWEQELITYFVDEPNSADEYSAHRIYSKWIKEAGGKDIKYMITEQPFDPDPFKWNGKSSRSNFGSLMNSPIDIWAAVALLYFPKDMAEVRSKGSQTWVYQWDEPYIGGQFIDSDGMSMRTWGWIAWKYHLDGLFYWAVNYWSDDPYGEPNSQGKFMGDGTLFYPGKPLDFNGPISSFRMKSFRRGLQDYEYFRLLKEIDPTNSYLDEIGNVLPTALGMGSHRTSYRELNEKGTWSRDPEEWNDLINMIGLEIERLMKRKDNK